MRTEKCWFCEWVVPGPHLERGAGVDGEGGGCRAVRRRDLGYNRYNRSEVPLGASLTEALRTSEHDRAMLTLSEGRSFVGYHDGAVLRLDADGRRTLVGRELHAVRANGDWRPV